MVKGTQRTPYNVYKVVGLTTQMLNDKGLVPEDATMYAPDIESRILMNGFTGSFEGYDDSSYDSAIEIL